MGWGGIVIDDQDQPLAHEDSEFRKIACEMLMRRMMIEKIFINRASVGSGITEGRVSVSCLLDAGTRSAVDGGEG